MLLTRSGSFVTSPRPHQPQAASLSRPRNPDGSQMRSYLGINSDDDSMHEKYFKESTPQSKRRNTASQDGVVLTASKKSSDSSPQSPMSPQVRLWMDLIFCYSTKCVSLQKTKATRPGNLGNIVASKNGSLSSFNSSHKKTVDSELLNLDLTAKPERWVRAAVLGKSYFLCSITKISIFKLKSESPKSIKMSY